MRTRTGAWALALALAVLAAPATEAPARKNKRFGIEGEVIRYDEERQVLVVRVLETKVPGRFATGNTVGGKAPKEIKRGKQYEFAVEPEGSVLRRTVIKAETGGGLDLTGTKEGFKQAVAKIPKDRPVVMSLERSPDAAVEAGAPRYKILLVQIQMTIEDLIRRWERISVED